MLSEFLVINPHLVMQARPGILVLRLWGKKLVYDGSPIWILPFSSSGWFMLVLSFQIAALLIEMVFGTEVQWQLSLLTFNISPRIVSFLSIIL